MEGLLYIAFLVWAVVAGLPYARGAITSGRLAAWCGVTLAMIAGPAALVVLLVVLVDQAGLGASFAVGALLAGGLVFFVGTAMRDALGEVRSLAVRFAGWSLLIAPMLLSWVLFVFIPLQLVGETCPVVSP